jgi:hypothetical protein
MRISDFGMEMQGTRSQPAAGSKRSQILDFRLRIEIRTVHRLPFTVYRLPEK